MSVSQKVNGHNDEQYKMAVSPVQEALFKKLNPLDYELYEFGKGIAAERTRYAKMRLLQLVPKSACRGMACSSS